MDKNIYVDKDFLSEELKKKADSSHGTHLTLGTTSSTAYRGDYGNTAYTHSQSAHAPSNAQKNSDITKAEIEAKLTGNITSHTHSYAGSSSAGGAANSVKSNFIVKLNGGSTEGTDMFTFNGSAAKTVNVTTSSIGAAASSHVHSAADISSGTLAADRLPASGVTTGNYGPSADSSPGHNGTFSVPYITIDAKGRVTSAATRTITLPSDNNTDTKVTNTLNTTTKFYMTGTTATSTNTGTQYFDTGIFTTANAGQLQVTGGLITGSDIVSDTAVTDELGTSTVPWANTYAKVYNLRANATGTTYGFLSAITVGTTSTTGEARLALGNNIATGTADNSYGRVLLYGTSSGYTALAQNNNTTNNITVTLPNASGTLALTSHTHSYAGSSSAGGAATSANKVNSNLVVKLNGGSTEGTNLFTFNGSAAKTIDITPASIGAAASSHGTHLALGTGSGNAYYGDKGKIAYDHSQATHAPTNAQKNSDITKAEIEAKLTGAITSHSHSYLPTAGGTMTGAITLANSTSGQIKHKLSTGTATETLYITTGDNLRVGSASIGRVLLYSTNNPQAVVNGSTHTLYHTGNKPSAADIGAAASSHGTHVSYGGNGSATTVSRSDHTHNYAGSSSAGGAATSANKVNASLTIKLNGGSTEGTNLFTFNGSAAKSINITPSAIGAAGSSHGTHVEWSSTAPKVAGTAAVGSETKCARGDHVHAAQTSVSGNAGTATKLATARNLKIGATSKSFNGSADVSWSLKEIMNGQGLDASTACGTLYFNNGGTSHVGRLSMYNNADGDYTQLACYNVSEGSTKNYITIYPNHISFGSYVIARGYIKPYNNGSIDLGASEYRWRTVYSANGVSTTSDRTLKENIKYVRTGDTEINYDDMYNFVKNDLELATYNYTNSGEKHINFIAQDLLANEDGTDNKVGQFIINPVPVPPKEDIESGKPYPLLSYNTNIYTSVLAGALKQAIQEVEVLKEENKELKETLHSLVSRIEALENR